MNNRKQEIIRDTCIAVWALLGLLFVLDRALLPQAIFSGIGQTVILVLAYLKYDKENDPSVITREPPPEWIVHVGFLDWKKGELQEYHLIGDQAGIYGMTMRAKMPRFPPAHFKKVYFAKYVGLYRVPKR